MELISWAKNEALEVRIAISHNNPFVAQPIMTSANAMSVRANLRSIFMFALLMFTSLSPALLSNNENDFSQLNVDAPRFSGNSEPWNPIEQPWGQYSRTPTHNGTMPIHGPNGGPGLGNVSDVVEYGIIDNPVVNWALGDSDDYGSDLYGSIIGDFSNSITATNGALERCGKDELFAVIISSDTTSSKLSIVSGDDAKLAWQVDLGSTEAIRSTPVLLDVDGDGRVEILLAYDTATSLEVEMWSPELSCSESGWDKSGHENEKLWSMSDSDYRIGIQSPHFATSQSNHKAITQPLLADLELDGTPELVLSLVNENTNDPTVVSLSLSTSTPTSFDWEVVLDRGTHPSDPSWGALDSSNTAIVLTTIDSNSGNMWIWRIDGASGSLDWERVAISGTDSDSDSPRLRLPGPVIVQLDNDIAPEMILTIPTDSNGRTPGNGAKFVAMEMTSTSEIFDFRTPNGYADTQPLPIDTDGDSIHDRLCWVTWYSESSVNFNRKGMAGCHDISSSNPIKEWSKDMQRGSGNDNDEIGVSPPIWMDIDGDEYYELIIPFGKRLWAFNGEDGISSAISSGWSSPLSMPHRVWAAPAVADMDGDGNLDILIGDTLVSQLISDFAPMSDNRGISFNPNQPDPGDLVTVTGQFSNIGTMDNDDDLDVVLLQNGNEITRERFDDVKPVAPSGDGGPYTFSVDITAELGIHEFEMILDINGNLTESREDNNREVAVLSVVEPYVSQIDIPADPPRISPGTGESVTVSISAIGSRTDSWTLTWNTDSLPDDWTFELMNNQDINPILIPNTPVDIDFAVSIPSDALGDENSFVDLILTLDDDQNISSTVRLPIEVLRTRGFSVVGPEGLGVSEGIGKPGNIATAWIMVENLGNAYESTTSIDWSAPSWGGTPTLHNGDGTEVFSLNMAPNEKRELFVHLDTPVSILPGSATSTTMTMCIGSGQETLCQDLIVNFTASHVTVKDIHTRTLPNSSLSWQLDAKLPDGGDLKWNLVSAQMVNDGWIWNVDGDLVINGSNLEITGSAGQEVSGNIYLTLPINAVPQRHIFSTPDMLEDYHDIYFSMHILQVYRTEATILQPIPDNNDEPVSLLVETTHQVLLRLENPGNGEDEFLLTTEVIEGDSMTYPPGVEFQTYNPQRILGPLATTIATVDVTLSEDTPALEPFTLSFKWKSLGNESVYSIVNLLVQAEPDHSWQLEFELGTEHDVTPNQDVSLNFTAKNIGNANDTIILEPDFTAQYFGQDSSIWSTENISSSEVLVNETTNLVLNFTVPADTWQGTQISLKLAIYSNTLLVDNFTLNFTVLQVSGWKFNLSNTNLVVDPQGENLTLNIEHLGNMATKPWFSKAGSGWNVSLPDSGDIMQPYSVSTVTVFVTPPEGTIAGEVGVLKLRISDGDGSGEVVQEIPVRISTKPQIQVDSSGTWKVNQDGGMPTAWVENLGNDLASLNIQLIGLPNGWTYIGPDAMVVAPSQILGIPFNLIPNNGWDGVSFMVNIEVEHPSLGISSIPIMVENSTSSFASTPVISAISNRNVSIDFNGNSTLESTQSGISHVHQNGKITLVVPNSRVNFTLFEQQNQQSEYVIHIVGQSLPDVSAICQLNSGAFENLGLIPITGSVGNCELTASDSERLRGSFVLITNTGERIPVSESSVNMAESTTETFSINLSSWTTGAGYVDVALMFIDSFGRVIDEDSVSVISRSSGWNIGISSVETDGDITVGISRESATYQRLIGVTCKLTITKRLDVNVATVIVDIGGAEYAPVIVIKDPGDIEDGEQIEATIRCNAPYDIDNNPSDDSKSADYNEESSLRVSGGEILTSIMVAGILVVIAFFAGLLQIKEEKDNPKATNVEIKETEKVVEEIKVEEEIDDFNFEFEEEIEDQPEEVIDLDEDPVIIEETVQKEPDNSASGRLASLRDELDDDDVIERRPIRDRMDDFFNN